MCYAALDVSLWSLAICIIDHEGKVRLERSVPSDVPDLVRCLREVGEPLYHVGLEAGTLTQHPTYGLVESGFEVVCMEARQVTSVEAHNTRALISSVKVMQCKCIDLENQIRGLLKIFGVKLPIRLSRGAFDVAMREKIESDQALSYALLPMLEARGVLMQAFPELYRRVKTVAREDARRRRSMGIPGVGENTALSFKAAVDDPTRFESSRTVGAHFGLTPRRFPSGEKDNPVRISHADDGDARATLYPAANAMLMR